MDIVIRATVVFWALYILVRLMGKRELAQMTPFELILLVVTGDLIQQGVTHNDFSLTGSILGVTTFAFWALVLSWVTFLSPKAEELLDGRPVVIIRHGHLITENMRRARITTGEVQAEMRLAGIPAVEDVEWGIVEARGRLSFIQRGGGQQKQGAGQEDLPA